MVIDTHVIHYRSGGCFVMAKALHRLTGYPERCIDFGSFKHAFVVSESGVILDIHGEHTWDQFLAMLVAEKEITEKEITEKAVALGLVQHKDIPGSDNIYWRHLGYKEPSEMAIKKATNIAKRHPNLEIILQKHKTNS